MDERTTDAPPPGAVSQPTDQPAGTPESLDPAATPPDAAAAPVRRRGRAASINAVSVILLLFGGAIEGYAVALTLSETRRARRRARLGLPRGDARRHRLGAPRATLVGRGGGDRRVVVGLFAGMLGVYGVLVIMSAPSDDRSTWPVTLGLVAIGAASIAVIGLLSGAWPWLTATRPRPATNAPGATRLSRRTQPSQRRQVGGGPGARSGRRRASQSTRA